MGALLGGSLLLVVAGGWATMPLASRQAAELVVDPERAHAEVVRSLEAASGFLPVGFALEAMTGTPVAVHSGSDLQVAQVVEQDGVPVLLLAERSYFREGRMIDLADAAIDTVAHLFEALFELHEQRAGLLDTARRDQLAAVAAGLYTDLPAEHRLEALIDAQAQLVGHLMSIAATAERSARRGEDLCRKLEAPLFRLWERTGAEIEYLAAVWIEGTWRTTEVDLPPELRRAVLAGPLEGRWTGRAKEDFRRHCR